MTAINKNIVGDGADDTSKLVFLYLESRASSGRIVIELFQAQTPKTCENFRSLCKGIQVNSKILSYKGSLIHRVVAPEYLIQGGDITNEDGTGGQSIYGGTFEDENLGWRTIDSKGLVCMANSGPNTNTSQFFITLCAAPWLDDKCTVFGRVIQGMQVIEMLENVVVDEEDHPLENEEVVITDCGIELEGSEEILVQEVGKLEKEDKLVEEEKLVENAENEPRVEKKLVEELENEPRREAKRKEYKGRTQYQDHTRHETPHHQIPDGSNQLNQHPNRVILKGRGEMKYLEDRRRRENRERGRRDYKRYDRRDPYRRDRRDQRDEDDKDGHDNNYNDREKPRKSSNHRYRDRQNEQYGRLK